MSKFKSFLEDINLSHNDDAMEEYFTKADIIEMVEMLEDDELQEVGEMLVELIYDESWEDEDREHEGEDEMEESLNEVRYFDKKKNQLNREKKKNPSERRKLAKERKKWYKKNKAKVKRKQKLYRKKAKRQPNMVRKHR